MGTSIKFCKESDIQYLVGIIDEQLDETNQKGDKELIFKNLKSVKIINMINNRGHGRCNAAGLKYIYENEDFDYVLTVCDSANEICPTFHNAKNKIHNSFEDPSKESYESDTHAMDIYNQTVKDISTWINQLDF